MANTETDAHQDNHAMPSLFVRGDRKKDDAQSLGEAMTACCRSCEYWLPGTLPEIVTAEMGECLSADSSIDYAPADHLCPHYSEDATAYERAPAPVRTARRPLGHG